MKPTTILTGIACTLCISAASGQYGTYPGVKTAQDGKIVANIVNANEFSLSSKEELIRGNVRLVFFTDYNINADGKVMLSDSGYNQYDRNGQLIHQRIYLTGSGDTVQRHCIYAEKRLMSMEYSYSGKPDDCTITRYKCDSLQRITGKKTRKNSPLLPADRSASRIIYDYDQRGNIVKETRYDDAGEVSLINTFRYNADGTQSAYLIRRSQNNTVDSFYQVYDINGHKIAGNNSSTMSWRAQNDKNGRRIHDTLFNADGSIYLTSIHAYDKWGNELENMTYNKDGAPSEMSGGCEYEYDATGNITKYTKYLLSHGRRIPYQSAEMRYTYWK